MEINLKGGDDLFESHRLQLVDEGLSTNFTNETTHEGTNEGSKNGDRDQGLSDNCSKNACTNGGGLVEGEVSYLLHLLNLIYVFIAEDAKQGIGVASCDKEDANEWHPGGDEVEGAADDGPFGDVEHEVPD